DVLRVDLRILKRETDRRGAAGAVLCRRGDVVRVGRRAIPGQLAEDVRPARLRVLQALKDEYRCAFAHHQPVAVGAEGRGRMVVAGGVRADAVERPDAEGVDASLRAAGDHQDRKSTRLNSSHVKISYAVFCLK